jgi:hypothetical protein
LGRKRSVGKGKIVKITTEVIEKDYSVVKEGKAMRYIPQKGACRLVRPRPPYWNLFGRVPCCEVGDILKVE